MDVYRDFVLNITVSLKGYLENDKSSKKTEKDVFKEIRLLKIGSIDSLQNIGYTQINVFMVISL